ncbi:MAG TPA: hypothetical protein VH023_14040 [Rhodopila sp.]|nr:hypothetical protein [Rhodopila sp.]
MTQPTGTLLPYLLAVLTPLLTAGGILDPDLARQAAMETIAACQAAGNHQLLSTGQIVAFALAALENLRLSAPPDVSLSMKLKLRGNANALNRASQKTAAMPDGPATAPDQHPIPPEPDPADPIPSLQSARTVIAQARAVTPASEDRETDLRWGQAMTDIAAEYTAELPALPPDQRRTHLIRIDALAKIAGMLGRGDAPPLKSRLLAGTAMPA